ncbi:MAG: hypothetical protein H7Y11_10860, partial [Armatimonadetes bacterium]|nr:hypothetical protein [Anaerolineae bacterium]
MVFEDMLKAVDQLSLHELRRLQAYIKGREQQMTLRAGTLDMEALLEALAAMRVGMT